MKKQYLIMSLVVFAFLAGCQKESETPVNPLQNTENEALKSGAEDPCHEESFTIYGGQTIPVGTLYVSNDGDEIFVTYDLSGTDWYLEETHVYVGSEEDLPLNGGGNPKIGHFPYSSTHSGEQYFTYTLDRADFDSCFTVAAHAVVVQMDESGNQTAEETAWADGGTEFPGKRWGWYLQEFCSQDCEDECISAWAFNVDHSICFTDPMLGFNEYGWTTNIDIQAPEVTICTKNDLISCPTNCDQSGGLVIGEVSFTDRPSEFGGFSIGFGTVQPGYFLEETYVWIGSDPLPMVNGSYSIDPQDFPYKHLNLNGATGDVHWFGDYLTGQNVYIVAYAVYSKI